MSGLGTRSDVGCRHPPVVDTRPGGMRTSVVSGTSGTSGTSPSKRRDPSKVVCLPEVRVSDETLAVFTSGDVSPELIQGSGLTKG